MMATIDQFIGKKKPMTKELKLNPVQPSPADLTERHAKALSFVSDLTEENNRLHTDNGRLQADLNLALMRIRDLEKAATERDYDLEAYRRYSVEIKTHMQHIIDSADALTVTCKRANEAALEAGEQQHTETVVKKVKSIEDTIAEVVKQESGPNAQS
jgi:chromosome segregation ATPase